MLLRCVMIVGMLPMSAYAWDTVIDCGYDNNDFEEINLTDTPISEEDFNKFSALDKQYDFYSHIKPVEKEKSKIFVCDETITSFYVRYGEAGFGVKTSGEPYEAVNQCFF